MSNHIETITDISQIINLPKLTHHLDENLSTFLNCPLPFYVHPQNGPLYPKNKSLAESLHYIYVLSRESRKNMAQFKQGAEKKASQDGSPTKKV